MVGGEGGVERRVEGTPASDRLRARLTDVPTVLHPLRRPWLSRMALTAHIPLPSRGHVQARAAPCAAAAPSAATPLRPTSTGPCSGGVVGGGAGAAGVCACVLARAYVSSGPPTTPHHQLLHRTTRNNPFVLIVTGLLAIPAISLMVSVTNG